MNKLINAVAFQAVWWACVLGVAGGSELQAVVFGLLCIGMHLYLSPVALVDAKLAACALLVGIAADTLLQYAGVIQFHGWAYGMLSPCWLWVLWCMFALTLNASLALLKSQPLLMSAVLGLLVGPLTYYAGARWGAATWSALPVHVLLIGVVWSIALPGLVALAKRWSPAAAN